jgi:hypothetical protein
MSAAATIQIHNGQKYQREQLAWVDDVRAPLALYLLLAVDSAEHAPPWLLDYMTDSGLLIDAETWEPSRAVVARLVKMRRPELVSLYRHGAIVARLLAKRLVRVEPSTGALVVKSPSVLWERVNMMSRLYDEATDRLVQLLERWERA